MNKKTAYIPMTATKTTINLLSNFIKFQPLIEIMTLI